MPWWFWFVLWSLLILLSAVWLAWHIFRLIEKGAQTYDQFVLLNNNFADSWDHAITRQLQRIRKVPEPGIFVPVSQAYADYQQGKDKRLDQRISRRIQRRDSLGQPQRFGDLIHDARKGATHG